MLTLSYCTSLSRPDAYLCSRLEISVCYGRPSAMTLSTHRLWSVGQSNATHQVLETRIGAEAVPLRPNLQRPQPA